LRYLRQQVQCDRIVIGTDDSFPTADMDPLGSLKLAGFTEEEINRIANGNPSVLFKI